MRKNEIIGIVVVFGLFILAAWIAHAYTDELESLMYLAGTDGLLLYFLITLIAVVIAPVSTFPLMPIAVALWGSMPTAIASIAGWTIGSVLAFLLAKYLGRPFAKRFVDIERAEAYARVAAGKRPFVTVTLLRMVVPVDLLSYALGLFLPMPLWQYTLATLIGVTPFAIVFSYTASLPLIYQAIVVALAGLIAFVVFRRVRRVSSR